MAPDISKNPPHQLVVGRVNFFILASLKVVPLSEIIRPGNPLLPMNLLKTSINEFADGSGASLRWIALVLANVNRTV